MVISSPRIFPVSLRMTWTSLSKTAFSFFPVNGSQTNVEEKEGYRRVERSFGSFRRAFTLPKGVDVDGVSAKTEHGQLFIHIPKPVAEIPRKIKVNQAEQLSG